MNKRIKSLTCFVITIFVVLVSCKKEKKIADRSTKNNYEITMDFPDTVFLGKGYYGKINYKNDLDTVTTKLLDIRRLRFIEFGFLKTTTLNYDYKYLKKNMIDTFYSETNRTIPLYNIYFNKLGVNFIDGIITDQVRIDTIMLHDGIMQPRTRIITNEFRVTKKVFVIKDRTKK
ncbi:hypothetical protein [[Flexibacter] sp. ATCC 35103]|uniref:hypothetical protein n=1 Tax=[Flexibacter] sp. ATCC 35103 TaxID=1937528 RepID=UPI0009C5CBD4|nr:hypothetical protein [[Flexibacter] sp. ATCC 35103]OMQ11775.1 hypothetical protein BXU01_09640 [[Flexibacter] sp. ATCC 35103]